MAIMPTIIREMANVIKLKETLKHRKFQASENFNYISNERIKEEVKFSFSQSPKMLNLKHKDLLA